MIFGETYEQYAYRMTTPHRWFTWRPVFLDDGRVVWLESVIRFRVRHPTEATIFSAWWTYKLPYEG